MKVRALKSGLMLLGALLVTACGMLPARQAVDAANVIYTEGSAQHMIAAQVPADAKKVYGSFVRVINENPETTIVNRKDVAMLLEATRGELRVTGQVTDLGPGRSLLYIWADAGDSGYSGREVARKAIDAICEELGVSVTQVQY